MGYVTYPATNPIGEISTILLCSYTVGYATYLLQPILDGKSQQSCCVPTLWDISPILQPILDGKSQQSCCVPTLWDMSPILHATNPRWVISTILHVVFLHCGICHLSCRWEISTIMLCSYTSYFVGIYHPSRNITT